MHRVGVGLFVLACAFSSGAKQNKVIHISSPALCLCSLIVSVLWHRVNCGRAARDPLPMSTRGQQQHIESSCPSCELERVKKNTGKKKKSKVKTSDSWDDEGAFSVTHRLIRYLLRFLQMERDQLIKYRPLLTT